MPRYETASRIARDGVVAVVRSHSPDLAREQALALLKAGQRVVEVSMTTPGALDVVADLSHGWPAHEALIGVGTVLDEATVRMSELAGARFVVSPTVNRTVLRAAHCYGMATLAGALSPTEAATAIEEGADFVKLFPASVYGADAVRHLLAPFPQLALVPTGGVPLELAPDYIRAGAVAVGIGSELTSGDPRSIEGRVRQLRTAVAREKAERTARA